MLFSKQYLAVKNISNDYTLASLTCCMIHELRAPSYCPNLDSYILKKSTWFKKITWFVC